MVKTSGFSDCSNLSVQVYNRMIDIQKFITLRPFIVLGSVNNRWKDEKLLYIFSVQVQV
jgi:hypothetical protein